LNLEKYNFLEDVYYSKEYISLYLKDDEEIFEFEYKEDDFIFFTIAIKRPITKIGNQIIDDGYYDLETAYGYGGFYVNTENEEFLKKAFEKYNKKCLEENIIAEFIRFHPFNNFPLHHSKFLDFNVHDRDTVYVNLQNEYELIQNLYASSLKRNINKAKKLELNFKAEDINAETIKAFIDLYNLTMQKNNASDFYFFDQVYFENLFNLKNVELYSVVYNDKIINMVIMFNSNGVLYYHLGSTHPEYYSLNANPYIFDNIIRSFSQKNSFLYFGGGTTSASDDSLLKFKQKFSSLRKPFYIGGKIYNDEIYNKYKTIWKEQSKQDIKYFLKYRLEIK
jgi:hypothetical protein